MTNSAFLACDTPVPAPIRRAAWVLAAAVMVAVPSGVLAQEEPGPLASPPQMVGDSAAVSGGASPGGAFLRAALLPGWGHASIGSYTRGAFYFAAEMTTGWGLLRTQLRIGEAKDRAAFREAVLRSRLEALGTAPEDMEAALEADETLQDLNDLASARREEREDWAALGIFLMFLAGADAFVSAHLKDFPTPITLDAAPLPGGRVELRVGVGLPNY